MKVSKVRRGASTTDRRQTADASLYGMDQKYANVLAWIGLFDSMTGPQVCKRSQI